MISCACKQLDPYIYIYLIVLYYGDIVYYMYVYTRSQSNKEKKKTSVHT